MEGLAVSALIVTPVMFRLLQIRWLLTHIQLASNIWWTNQPCLNNVGQQIQQYQRSITSNLKSLGKKSWLRTGTQMWRGYMQFSAIYSQGRHGRGRMVVGFTATYAFTIMLWVWISRWTTLCDTWLATGRCFSPGPPVSSTNKTDHYDITEILLKVALNIIKLNLENTTSAYICANNGHIFVLYNV